MRGRVETRGGATEGSSGERRVRVPVADWWASGPATGLAGLEAGDGAVGANAGGVAGGAWAAADATTQKHANRQRPGADLEKSIRLNWMQIQEGRAKLPAGLPRARR